MRCKVNLILLLQLNFFIEKEMKYQGKLYNFQSEKGLYLNTPIH
ncbi:hypothetical protein LSO9J_10057 [Candidatus Liberibacter solanacearum]